MNLLDLPDEILVRILLLHGHNGLLDLATVCPRFESLLSHSVVWRHINFWRPVSLRELRKCLTSYAGPLALTRSLTITGWHSSNNGQRTSNMSVPFFKDLEKKCPRLRRIRLNRVFDNNRGGEDFKMAHLPKFLERVEVHDSNLNLRLSILDVRSGAEIYEL